MNAMGAFAKVDDHNDDCDSSIERGHHDQKDWDSHLHPCVLEEG